MKSGSDLKLHYFRIGKITVNEDTENTSVINYHIALSSEGNVTEPNVVKEYFRIQVTDGLFQYDLFF